MLTDQDENGHFGQGDGRKPRLDLLFKDFAATVGLVPKVFPSGCAWHIFCIIISLISSAMAVLFGIQIIYNDIITDSMSLSTSASNSSVWATSSHLFETAKVDICQTVGLVYPLMMPVVRFCL